MITTNTPFLQPELMEVIRMFKDRSIDFDHTFLYENNKFINKIKVFEKEYDFCDEYDFKSEIEYKRYVKRFAKLALYKVIQQIAPQTMPWGALTGIRPVKLAYTELEKGKDYVDMFKKYDVSEQNIQLVTDILNEQKGVYFKDENACDLFISIPFCPSKCEYCSFITAEIKYTRRYLDDYVNTLVYELEQSQKYIKILKSVYIGGGTPLVLDCVYLEKILMAVSKIRQNDCEFTVEAGRPDVFCDEKLELLKKYGVTRICINPQSFKNETLVKIGRKHTAEDIYKAFETCQKYKFSINCDLIAGLVDETVEDFVLSVKKAIELKPQNITVHTLCLKKGARLSLEKEYLNVDGISEMINQSRIMLKEAGYKPYYMYRQKYMAGNCENTGYTLKNYPCVYNIDVMEEITDNLACGANAVTKRVFFNEDRIERVFAPKDIKTYIEKIDRTLDEKKKLF